MEWDFLMIGDEEREVYFLRERANFSLGHPDFIGCNYRFFLVIYLNLNFSV
jgi:hypothetical protein